MTNQYEYPGSLHNHTDYSNFRLRDSTNRVETLMARACELGHNGIAYTEHETIANAIHIEEAYAKIKEKYPNFKVIRGNEIYLVRNGLNGENYNSDYDRYTHFILLAMDAEGHKQIRQLSTRAWKRSYMARGMRRVPTYYQDLIDVIEENRGHLVASSACIGGTLGVQLLRYKQNPNETHLDKIKKWCLQIQNIFGKGNFYLEIQPSNNSEQIYVNKWIIKLSEELEIPFIITNDAHYLRKEDLKIERIFLRSQNGEREVDNFYATTYLMSDEEIHSYMDSQIGVENVFKAYKNIQNILDKAQDYTLKKPLRIPSLPWRDQEKVNEALTFFYCDKMPYLLKFLTANTVPERQLAYAVMNGIKSHKDLQNDAAYEELNLCLKDTWISSQVNKASWAAYFLNLQKTIDICWEAGSIVGPGRGSGVGFLLLYCLDITQINPLRETTKTYRFRFLNPERVSVLDVDTDVSGLRRNEILDYIRKYYGQDRVANVLTLRTEKSKSAILAAARGLGIDVDIAQYIASLIPSERGKLWSLKDCYYGNKEEGRAPIKEFINQMEQYPELWEVVQKTEGLIVGCGEHAGGLIFVDESFDESTALMRAPNGDIMTQFELHTAEKTSLIKIDLLSIEAIDKIQTTLQLLIEKGYIEEEPTLRQTYEKYLGIYNIERNDPKMWQMLWEHKIPSIFQMEKESGKKGIELIKPKNVDELATLNSVIRLMAPEKGAEQPLDMWARYRNNIEQWYDEMRYYNLSSDEIEWLANYPDITDGIAESQEALMKLVQEERMGDNTLSFADKCRKGLAKKDGPLFAECEKEFYRNAEEKKCSMNLAHYVWDVLLRVQRNYSFNKSHTLAYSLVGLQEMNLAYRYPIIFWNCACLISDSGGLEANEDGIYQFNDEEEQGANGDTSWDSSEAVSIETFDNYEEDDEDEDEDDNAPVEKQKKKKTKTTNYGKIATAIGKMAMEGIKVSPPDINKSSYTFSPDPEANIIRYGMSGIVKVGEQVIKDIIANRPYTSMDNFLSKVKVTKPQVINLIKAGAFDEFGDRIEIMHEYINKISDTKSRITLQNMKMLIDFKLIPDEYDMERRVYNFNKYLKKMKMDKYYGIDNIAMSFIDKNFTIDDLVSTDDTESGFMIKQITWDKIYQSYMDRIRPFIKEHNKELLNAVNEKLTKDVWDKYCLGSLSKWEMDSVSFYSHKHELAWIDNERYGFVNFFNLPNEPEVDRIITIKGKQVPLFKINRIVGVVLDKNKDKKMVTLLTTDGVVTVKIYGGLFSNYDKQISEKGADGRKHVIEKSIFTRGNKIAVCGVKVGANEFLAKKYARIPYHLVENIDEIYEDGAIKTSYRET